MSVVPTFRAQGSHPSITSTAVSQIDGTHKFKELHDTPICSHSAPPLIMRLHSSVSRPKSEARTEGEMIARGMMRSKLFC